MMTSHYKNSSLAHFRIYCLEFEVVDVIQERVPSTPLVSWRAVVAVRAVTTGLRAGARAHGRGWCFGAPGIVMFKYGSRDPWPYIPISLLVTIIDNY